MHSQLLFNECIARHNVPQMFLPPPLARGPVARWVCVCGGMFEGHFIPPSSGLVAGSGGRRIASSSGAPRRI